jgi:hypothetical protein
MYPVCHDYRYISGDDSKGRAKAHDPNAKRLEYCNICKRSVTNEQIFNSSCHTYCIFCGFDAPHNYCAEFESRGTRSSVVKFVLCMTCCKYVFRYELEAGTCHSKPTLVNTQCVSSRDTTAGARVASSTNDMAGYREIGGDILCKTVSREEKVLQHHGGTCQDSTIEGRHRKRHES